MFGFLIIDYLQLSPLRNKYLLVLFIFLVGIVFFVILFPFHVYFSFLV